MIHHFSLSSHLLLNLVLTVFVWRMQPKQQVEGQQGFFEIISSDESATLRVIMQITSGIQNIVDKVQTLLIYWEKKYKHMWDQDKDAYIR